LEGKLGEKIQSIRGALVDLLAHIEASIDFSEEGIAPDEGDELRGRLESVREQITALLATADEGRLLREGVRVVIYGATNAGKSSLLNRLLGFERVIVSDSHGTTRDTIEETINLRGVPIRLLDTAGLRTSASEIEREGIARTEQSLQKADLRLHIVDRTAPRPAHFAKSTANGNEIVVLNKSDLPEHEDWKNYTALRISCATGNGLNTLESEILSRIGKQNLRPENALAINMRHRDCLRRALEACDRACKTMDDAHSPEYIALDLNEALRAVGEVVGIVGVEQILDSVFGQFCIGK
jgi:tRNA modification GTPase